MDSDYGYSSEEQSYENASEDDFDFDSQAEVETAAKKVCGVPLPHKARQTLLPLSHGILPACSGSFHPGVSQVLTLPWHLLQAPYIVFNEKQLRERQQEAIDAVAGVLSISEGEVVRVLRQYKWCARMQYSAVP